MVMLIDVFESTAHSRRNDRPPRPRKTEKFWLAVGGRQQDAQNLYAVKITYTNFNHIQHGCPLRLRAREARAH
jgi:hypothetical protein